MVYDKANELAKLLKESDEFRNIRPPRKRPLKNDTTASLIKEYHNFSWRRRRQWCPVKRMMRRCSAFRR